MLKIVTEQIINYHFFMQHNATKSHGTSSLIKAVPANALSRVCMRANLIFNYFLQWTIPGYIFHIYTTHISIKCNKTLWLLNAIIHFFNLFHCAVCSNKRSPESASESRRKRSFFVLHNLTHLWTFSCC